ncbi:MAG: hydrogenase maturation nickel metallochaperone HypA [Patescibacteria group bacterium]|jgi:hydrogenase nickel incorporation protein HypA/HybF
MHELPITQALLKKVLEVAEENKLIRVTKVNVILGRLSGFVDDSIDLYWNILTEHTIAAGSKVMIKRTPNKIKCLKCGYQKLTTLRLDTCPKCSSFKLVIVGGDELVLKNIEGENDKNNQSK